MLPLASVHGWAETPGPSFLTISHGPATELLDRIFPWELIPDEIGTDPHDFYMLAQDRRGVMLNLRSPIDQVGDRLNQVLTEHRAPLNQAEGLIVQIFVDQNRFSLDLFRAMAQSIDRLITHDTDSIFVPWLVKERSMNPMVSLLAAFD